MKYRLTRNLPYEAPNLAGHNDLSARHGTYLDAVDTNDALLKMAAKFPKDVMRTSMWDAFTVAPVMSDEAFGKAADCTDSRDTEPPSDNAITLVDSIPPHDTIPCFMACEPVDM